MSVQSGHIRIMPIDSSPDGKSLTTPTVQVGCIIEVAEDEDKLIVGNCVVVLKSELNKNSDSSIILIEPNPIVAKSAIIGLISS